VRQDFRGIHLKNSASQPDLSGARPTLLSKPRLIPLTKADTGEESILSSSKMGGLGNKPRSAPPKRSGLKLFAVLGISAAAALFGYQYLSSSPSGSTLASVADSTAAKTLVASAAPASALPGVASPAAAEPAAPPLSAPAPPVAVAPEAAQIVNESHLPTATPPASGEAKLTAALEGGAKPPAIVLEKAPESKVAEHAPAKVRTSTKAEKASVVAEKKASSASKTQTTNAQKAASEASRKDVDLLAALLAHNGDFSTQPNQASRPPVSVKGGTGLVPQKTNALGSPAPEKVAKVSGAPSREVVERQASESTAALLKRCGALGFLEGELCRVRICSGLWDTDAACKARLSPTQ
jgi:hypothetical protein